MARNEKLEGVAEVLMMAAAKVRELSVTGAKDGYVSREANLAVRIEGIAKELMVISSEGKDGAPA